MGSERIVDVSRVALKRRRTRIVATVGPASSSPEMLDLLLVAGVDVFRLNFSHGTQELHGETCAAIRKAASKAGRTVAVLADLCGPKIRVGQFEGGSVQLENGARVTITVREGVTGTASLIPSEYRELAADVKPLDRILLDDGKLELRVVSVSDTEIACDVVNGGTLSNRKGMNLPGVNVSAPALTEKDRSDARFAASLGVDYLALSFVRSAQDVFTLKEFLGPTCPPVVAKIEKPEAVTHFAAILDAADGIMVARGDLGVEMAAEEVPLIQRELVQMSIAAHKPVIVATQMLESMIENVRPTRAEVTDVAFAAMSSADAVMLSAETASGKHPVQAVATMDRILRLVEGYQWAHGQFGRPVEPVPDELNVEGLEAVAISRATAQMSRDLQARAVVVPSRTGRTVRMVAANRPAAPVVAIVADAALARRLVLHWGVTPEVVPVPPHEDPAGLTLQVVQQLELADPGQFVLLVWEAGEVGSGPSVTALRVGG